MDKNDEGKKRPLPFVKDFSYFGNGSIAWTQDVNVVSDV